MAAMQSKPPRKAAMTIPRRFRRGGVTKQATDAQDNPAWQPVRGGTTGIQAAAPDNAYQGGIGDVAGDQRERWMREAQQSMKLQQQAQRQLMEYMQMQRPMQMQEPQVSMQQAVQQYASPPVGPRQTEWLQGREMPIYNAEMLANPPPKLTGYYGELYPGGYAGGGVIDPAYRQFMWEHAMGALRGYEDGGTVEEDYLPHYQQAGVITQSGYIPATDVPPIDIPLVPPPDYQTPAVGEPGYSPSVDPSLPPAEPYPGATPTSAPNLGPALGGPIGPVSMPTAGPQGIPLTTGPGMRGGGGGGRSRGYLGSPSYWNMHPWTRAIYGQMRGGTPGMKWPSYSSYLKNWQPVPATQAAPQRGGAIPASRIHQITTGVPRPQPLQAGGIAALPPGGIGVGMGIDPIAQPPGSIGVGTGIDPIAQPWQTSPYPITAGPPMPLTPPPSTSPEPSVNIPHPGETPSTTGELWGLPWLRQSVNPQPMFAPQSQPPTPRIPRERRPDIDRPDIDRFGGGGRRPDIDRAQRGSFFGPRAAPFQEGGMAESEEHYQAGGVAPIALDEAGLPTLYPAPRQQASPVAGEPSTRKGPQKQKKGGKYEFGPDFFYTPQGYQKAIQEMMQQQVASLQQGQGQGMKKGGVIPKEFMQYLAKGGLVKKFSPDHHLMFALGMKYGLAKKDVDKTLTDTKSRSNPMPP